MSLKDVIYPFYVWKRALSKPYTTKKPLEDRPGAKEYRGFHKNDLDKCIGCGTCEDICQNESIDLVPVEGIETTKNDSGLRPKIDYGRCCWCALCIDICPTGSLTMSNEYKWVEEEIEGSEDAYFYVPGADEKPWDNEKRGYHRDDNFKLLNYDRIQMDMLSADERVKSFLEMVKGYSKEQAVKEAERCVQCGLCIATCPSHMDIPGYIKAVREHDLETGMRILYDSNPLPAICGRVCTHRCEQVCAMGKNGEPISIRWLKRYIVDQVELPEYADILKDDFIPNHKKVAIIGSGPAGLSAAYYLAVLGYDITVYEAREKTGGMLRYGIPEYRLPYEQIDKDIAYIESLGVKVLTNTAVGNQISFQDLYDKNDAVFFSTGLDIPYQMGIDGENLDGVISGLKLLDAVTRNLHIDLGKKVAVIGGGNVAMDAARTSITYGAEVDLLYRRRVQDMPADEEEIHESQAENVNFMPQTMPLRIEKTKENRLNLVYGKAEMVAQNPGERPRPKLLDGEYSLFVDKVIVAIGQEANFSYIPKEIKDKIKFERGSVVLNDFGQTSVKKLFAGGDIANKTKDAISAIADGNRAAKGIDYFLK